MRRRHETRLVTEKVRRAGRGYGDHKRFLAARSRLHDDLDQQLLAQGVSEQDRYQIWVKTEAKLWYWLREQTRWPEDEQRPR